jgi:hypothetical protein
VQDRAETVQHHQNEGIARAEIPHLQAHPPIST